MGVDCRSEAQVAKIRLAVVLSVKGLFKSQGDSTTKGCCLVAVLEFGRVKRTKSIVEISHIVPSVLERVGLQIHVFMWISSE